jgi:quercetin dioxygenase-like cupin family protein
MNTNATDEGLGTKLGEGLGERLIWLGELTILKVTGAETGGRYTLAEVYVTQEGAPPLHVHHNEDEAFYVLEGEITVHVGERTLKGPPGAFLWAPRDIPHTYTVDSRPYARVLFFFSPAGFEGLIRATSEPAQSLTPPLASEVSIDYEQLESLAREYGVEFLG